MRIGPYSCWKHHQVPPQWRARWTSACHINDVHGDAHTRNSEACSQSTRWRRIAATGGTLTVDQYVLSHARPDGTIGSHLDEPAGGRRCVQQRPSSKRLLRVRVTLLPVETPMRRQLPRPGTARRCEPPPSQRSPPLDKRLGATSAKTLQRGPRVFIDETLRLVAPQAGRLSAMKERAAGRSLARLHESAGKLRGDGCRGNSWSRRRRTCGLARRLGTAAVRTGEAGLQVRKALMHVATKT